MKKLIFLLQLLPCQIFAQQFATELQQKLDDYYKTFIPINVHVFTNQPEYAPEDTIFFNVNLVTAPGHRPVAGKSYLQVVLLTEHENKLLANKFLITDGHGSNQIILPSSLISGNYYLGIWSDWMTGDDSLMYKKQIRVGVKKKVNESYLRAAPEGGNLITGLSTRVVIAGTPHMTGTVNENSEPVHNFIIGSDGTCSFYLTAKKNAHYEIVAGTNRQSLPVAKDDGVGMLVTRNFSKNSFRVYLTAPEKSLYRDQTLHLVITAQGIIRSSSSITFTNQTFFSIDVPIQQIPNGLIQITLLDDQKNVIAERLISNLSQQIQASLAFPKRQFKTRERIDVKLVTSLDRQSNVSLTCFNTSFTPYDSLQGTTIQSDLLIHGDIDFKSFGISARDNPSAIDNKLVLAKWSRFNWQKLEKKSGDAYYSQYMRFSGKLSDSQTNQPITGPSKITFFLNKNADTYQAYTNALGEFNVSMLFDFYDSDEVYYRVEQKGRILPNARVQLLESVISNQEVNGTQKISSNYYDLFEKRKTINASYAYHTKPEKPFTRDVTPSLIEDEIFGADITIKMEEYHLLPTMAETLREVLPYAQHRKIHGRDVVRIFNHDIREFRDTEPVYVIDGVMTDDTDYFLSLNPADVASIKLVHSDEKLSTFGAIGIGGMIIVETRIPDNHRNVSKGERTFTLKGLNKPLQQRVVSHAVNSTARVPDLRTNLLWQPSLFTNATGEASISFYASDVPGTYRIEGEGISSDGQLFTFQGEFEVVFEK